jgi:hypothetical protein
MGIILYRNDSFTFRRFVVDILLMKKRVLLFFLSLVICSTVVEAQQLPETTERKSPIRIALFAPLHLDSVFKSMPYGPMRKFPRYALPGLDFVQGAQIALDSFSFPGTPVNLFIYDSRMTALELDSVLQALKSSNIDGILAPVRDPELTSIASFAKQQQIPCWSASYPNDAGISSNPYFSILNPTLKTHCEAIFSYLLQNSETRDNIFLIRPTGKQEDRIAGYFQQINQPDEKKLLNYQAITLDSNYQTFESKLDSNRNNTLVIGSLDENFTESFIRSLAPIRKKYRIVVLGMPNWDGFSVFSKNNAKMIRDFPIIYTSPYFNQKNDSMSLWLEFVYLEKYKGKPSDHAFKGMEMTLQLAQYILKSRGEVSNRNFFYYSNPNLMPIRKSPEGPIDYKENKHVFFIRKMNGNASLNLAQ